jgi:hypothetical protein
MNAKEATMKREEKLEALLKEAESSPAIIAVRAQQKAEVLAKRQEASGKIAALRNEESLTLPKLQDELEAAEAKYLAAKKALEGLAENCREATLALRSERFMFDNAIRASEASLLESADPALDEAIIFFKEKLDYLRSPGRISRNAIGSSRNIINWTKIVKDESNADAVRAALRYCQDAVAELEKMKLSPALDAEKIAVLKAGMPSIDVFQESTGTKPMAKFPAAYVPRFRDVATDVIDALIQKANVLLTRSSSDLRARIPCDVSRLI